MTILVFDLDDTLYDELTYVKSGFQAVAAYLSSEFSLDSNQIFAHMWNLLEAQGRGKVFNDLLRSYGIYSKGLVKKCLSIYRTHIPILELDPEADNCLQRFTDYRKYIVTDGNKMVQHNKLVALGLYDRMEHCYVTHRYGIINAKPSPYCFLKIIQRERVHPTEVIYIGDNPHKDFVGIKPLGFKTIRIKQGQHKDVSKPVEFEADITISSLSELDEALIAKLINEV